MVCPLKSGLLRSRLLSLEVSGQIVVFERSLVLQDLVPALDLALCLDVAGRAPSMVHGLLVQPLCQLAGDADAAPSPTARREGLRQRYPVSQCPRRDLALADCGVGTTGSQCIADEVKRQALRAAWRERMEQVVLRFRAKCEHDGVDAPPDLRL